MPGSATTAVPSSAFPTQPDGVPFPTKTWPKGEWPIGVDRAVVDEAVDLAFAEGGSKRVRAVVIIHGGKLVYERYSPNREDGPGKIMPSYSIAKSFTSALVGILVKDGKLDVYAPAPIPDWSAESDPRGDITIDDLLRMSSGLRWSGMRYPDPAADLTRMLASEDAAAYVADKRLLHKPGAEFAYNEGNTMLINRIQAEQVGSGHDFREFMETKLLDKIGINRMETMFDPTGTWFGAISADTTALNFARFGLLYLRDGVWDGERILPEGWVEYTRTPSAASPEYGAGWWLDLERPSVFYAVGIRGQTIAVDPQHDLTFVTLATDSAISLPVSEAILNAFAAQK
jgi:CubicO group peptidase (beta-lactamase class C family)